MTPENVVDILVAANQYQIPRLKREAEYFIRMNWDSMGVQELSLGELESLYSVAGSNS